MRTAALALAGLVALLHVYFLVLEMFLWRTRARRVFGMTAEKAEATAQLAGNQGLYNGFLAAGIVWGMSSAHDATPRIAFFLVCVIAAGIYGAATVNWRILLVQALPAALALLLLSIS